MYFTPYIPMTCALPLLLERPSPLRLYPIKALWEDHDDEPDLLPLTCVLEDTLSTPVGFIPRRYPRA